MSPSGTTTIIVNWHITGVDKILRDDLCGSKRSMGVNFLPISNTKFVLSRPLF